MTKPNNIYLIGPAGCGKTTIGRFLARDLNLAFYDSDHQIETQTGASIPLIFDIEGEHGFRKREQRIIQSLTQKKNIVLATGGGAILDPKNRKYLATNGIVVYLKVSIEQQLVRTEKCNNRPLLDKVLSENSNLEKESHRHTTFKSMHTERAPLYEEIADCIFDTSTLPAHKITHKIIQFTQKPE